MSLKSFLLAFISFLALDFLWFSFVVTSFNARQLVEIGKIENGSFQISYLPALLVYVLMAAALTVFVLPKTSALTSMLHIFGCGALMGFIIYGVFDLTNLAILKSYPLPFAIVDMLWGTLSFGAVTTIVCKIAKS